MSEEEKKPITQGLIDKDALFKNNAYKEEHTLLNRDDYAIGRDLPPEVLEKTVFPPTALLHSNLFMYDSKGKNWFMNDMPIYSKWMPSEIEIYYTGKMLSSYHFKVFTHVVKAMEKREAINDIYFEKLVQNDVDRAVEQSGEMVVTPITRELMEKQARRKYQDMEGVFLTESEFKNTVGIHHGGDNAERIAEACMDMGKGILTIKTKFKDGRDNFEHPSQLMYVWYVPEKKAYYLALTPLVMDLFGLRTSMVNMEVMTNMDEPDKEKKKNGYFPLVYSTLITYERGCWHTNISLNEYLMRSPYYLFKLQHEGTLPPQSIIDSDSGSKIDGKTMTMNQVNKNISKARTNVLYVLQRVQELGMGDYSLSGRGDKARISLMLNRRLERKALSAIQKERAESLSNKMQKRKDKQQELF